MTKNVSVPFDGLNKFIEQKNNAGQELGGTPAVTKNWAVTPAKDSVKDPCLAT
jgi:hypothetical protein